MRQAWRASFHMFSASWIPTPGQARIWATLDRDHNRRVIVELSQAEAATLRDCLTRFLDDAEQRKGLANP